LTDERISLGARGEDLAVAHLRRHGWNVLQRNYRLRSGEIDIIARDGETLVFVEVKTRRSLRFGAPAAAVTPRKQARLGRLAQEYLARNKLGETASRFDVISVLLPTRGPAQIELITNAFEVAG